MTPERWQQVEKMFLAAAERPPEERHDFLLQNCNDDELRAEVESLLAHEVSDTFLRAPIGDTARSLTNHEDERLIGQRVGAYRITGVIGHGGMGAVYRAIRDDSQYLKEVALKLVKRGLDTEFVLHRFRYERQILASLEHAYIARLLDVGLLKTACPISSWSTLRANL
jgi:eukaryotic-like serine/threonine-protein kinase